MSQKKEDKQLMQAGGESKPIVSQKKNSVDQKNEDKKNNLPKPQKEPEANNTSKFELPEKCLTIIIQLLTFKIILDAILQTTGLLDAYECNFPS